MKKEAYILKASGKVIETKPKNGTDFSLEELNEIVGGYIEVIRTINDNQIMVLNEEGKLKHLPVNQRATALYPNLADIIVGDVLVCDRSMVK